METGASFSTHTIFTVVGVTWSTFFNVLHKSQCILQTHTKGPNTIKSEVPHIRWKSSVGSGRGGDWCLLAKATPTVDHIVSILVTPVFVHKKEFLFLNYLKGFWRSHAEIS